MRQRGRFGPKRADRLGVRRSVRMLEPRTTTVHVALPLPHRRRAERERCAAGWVSSCVADRCAHTAERFGATGSNGALIDGCRSPRAASSR